MINYILSECHCTYNSAEKKNRERPFVCDIENGPSFRCLAENCPYLSFRSTDEGLVYVGENSVSEKEILFGGEEDLQLWEKICKSKIKEAWEDYQKRKLADTSTYNSNDSNCINIIGQIKIDPFHNIILRKNPECYFYDDEVIVELTTPKKNYIVAVDSFSYEVNDSITNSIDECMTSAPGNIYWMLGAPCNVGGFELQLIKTVQNDFELRVVKSKISEHPITPFVIEYGLAVSSEMLYDWKAMLKRIKEKYEIMFDSVKPYRE